MIAFIITVFYVAGVIAAIDAVMTVRTSQGCIAWSVTLIDRGDVQYHDRRPGVAGKGRS